MSSPMVFKNYIDGEWCASSAGHTFENRNPADSDDLVGLFQASQAQDAQRAVDAAAAAFEG
ncbi:MAG: aldehyde dehydrogenase family protein, partial [Lacisediminimonas sp.]|nr:aldehyde dehydrogenase family protein [Lacisediminimonas sp.]